MSNQSKDLVYVIILNWNGWRDTLECLHSLSQVTHQNTKIIVVDNGSEDDSIDNLEVLGSSFTLIKSPKNLGFSGGNNLGIAAAMKDGAEYILLLNNDTVVDPEIVSEFLAAARSFPDAKAFGAKIYYYDDPCCLWYAGGSPSNSSYDCPGHRGSNERDIGLYNETEITNFINGCAFFISTNTIRQIGLLDENYFYMFEDVDWSERVISAGNDCLYVPNAKVWHKTHRSTSGSLNAHWCYFYERNRLLWLEKFRSGVPRYKVLFYQANLIIKKLGSPVKIRPPFIKLDYIKENLYPALGMLFGIIDYFRGYRGRCPDFIRFLGRR